MMFTRLILAISLFLIPFQAQDLKERLWEAAREGKTEEVGQVLDRGADPNAATRYGVTALHYAADRGYLETVRLLLSRGADPNAADSFYGATPLVWSLSNGHREVATLLVQKGAKDVGQALGAAIQSGDQALFEACLASSHLDDASKTNGLRIARRNHAQSMVDKLLAAGAKEEVVREEVPFSADELDRFPGKYRNEENGLVIQVDRDGDQLFAHWKGQTRTPLTSYGEGQTAGAEGDWRMNFSGRGGIVERVLLMGPGGNQLFSPVSDAELAELAALEERARERAAEYVENAPDRSAAPSQPWSSFRGYRASGYSDGQDLPTNWNLESGQNVLWKTPIPGVSTSSPSIAGGRVFLTTAYSSRGDEAIRTGLYGDVKPVEDLSEHNWKLYGLDLRTGEILWERLVHKGIPGVKRHTKSSQANSTPATDGKNVVVLFGTVGILADYDVDGKLLWKKDLGVLNSGWFYNADYEWGHASSPVIYRDAVLVQADIQGDSFLAAFRLSDGKELWRTPRDEIPTWGTPTIYEGATGPEVVTNGPTIRSYDPRDGKLLWHLAPNSEITVGTPVIHQNLIIITAGYPPVRPIYAVKAGSRGDLSLPEGEESSRNIAWSRSRGGTYIPTPLAYQGYLYLNANNGRLTCYDAATGEQIYRARIGGTGGSFAASPIASDGHLFFTSEDGSIFVAKAGPVYEDIARNEMNEVIMATPAISEKTLVVKTVGHVYGIARK